MKNKIELLYKAIKLSHDGINIYKGRDLKLNQLIDYKKQMDSIIKKISKKQTINLVESCAGNCFLSFYLAWHYRYEKKLDIKFICIERNPRLINEAKLTAIKLGLTNMKFIASNVEDVNLKNSVHVVYSLHACDLATDFTIFLGIKTKARFILSVSCCQFTIQKRVKKHLLKSITKHSIYKEQLTSMVADSIRSELLCIKGFKTEIFQFTSVKNTGRNIMLRASRTPITENKILIAKHNYLNLRNIFNGEPELGNLLRDDTFGNHQLAK